MTALELESITAAYGPYRAIDDISLAVGRGEVVALVGPNGAGKSTVARVCAGLVRPVSGRLRVGGRDLTGAAPWRIARARLASVPEGRGVFARLSVLENLELSFGRWLGPKAVREALEETFARFPILAERRHQRAGTLSGGQQRILSLAKVLADQPDVVVADELSLGLSPAAVDDLYQQLGALHDRGIALLVIEQRVDRVLKLADRAVVLDRGSVRFDGPPSQATQPLEAVLGGGSSARPAADPPSSPGA